MLKFYSGRWTREQIEAMSEAVDESCFSIMQLSGCVDHDSHISCKDCHYKYPCRDFMQLRLYLNELVENSVETVKN